MPRRISPGRKRRVLGDRRSRDQTTASDEARTDIERRQVVGRADVDDDAVLRGGQEVEQCAVVIGGDLGAEADQRRSGSPSADSTLILRRRR